MRIRACVCFFKVNNAHFFQPFACVLVFFVCLSFASVTPQLIDKKVHKGYIRKQHSHFFDQVSKRTIKKCQLKTFYTNFRRENRFHKNFVGRSIKFYIQWAGFFSIFDREIEFYANFGWFRVTNNVES